MQDLPKKRSTDSPSLFEKDFSILLSKLKVPGDFNMAQYDVSQVKVFTLLETFVMFVDSSCFLLSWDGLRGVICNWPPHAIQAAF